jgi:cell division protein FtsB
MTDRRNESSAGTRRHSRRVGSWEATALALQRERDALADENQKLVAENERLAAEATRLQGGINQLIRAKVEGTF